MQVCTTVIQMAFMIQIVNGSPLILPFLMAREVMAILSSRSAVFWSLQREEMRDVIVDDFFPSQTLSVDSARWLMRQRGPDI